MEFSEVVPRPLTLRAGSDRCLSISTESESNNASLPLGVGRPRRPRARGARPRPVYGQRPVRPPRPSLQGPRQTGCASLSCPLRSLPATPPTAETLACFFERQTLVLQLGAKERESASQVRIDPPWVWAFEGTSGAAASRVTPSKETNLWKRSFVFVVEHPGRTCM